MIDRPIEQSRTLIFGNGSFAEFGDCRENNKEGTITFTFRPSEAMRWRDRIPDEDYDEKNNWIKKTYDRDLTEPLDLSPDFQTWMLFCDYRGEECKISERIDLALLARVKSLRTEKEAYKMSATLLPMTMIRMIKYPEEARTKLLKSMKEQNKALNTNPFGKPEDDDDDK